MRPQVSRLASIDNFEQLHDENLSLVKDCSALYAYICANILPRGVGQDHVHHEVLTKFIKHDHTTC